MGFWSKVGRGKKTGSLGKRKDAPTSNPSNVMTTSVSHISESCDSILTALTNHPKDTPVAESIGGFMDNLNQSLRLVVTEIPQLLRRSEESEEILLFHSNVVEPMKLLMHDDHQGINVNLKASSDSEVKQVLKTFLRLQKIASSYLEPDSKK